MNLIFRMFRVYLSAWFGKKKRFLEASILRFTVLPNDLDVYFHMNNGRYQSIMDLGRIDIILRSGLWKMIKKKKWFPLVASATIEYKKSLMLFERYELTSKIVAWDRKWFYIEQNFHRGNKVVAIGYVKGLFRGPDGNVPSQDILAVVGESAESPPLPDRFKCMQNGVTK